jgi:hypothetical protein
MLELLDWATLAASEDLLGISVEPLAAELGWDAFKPGTCWGPTFAAARSVELELEFCWLLLLPGSDSKLVESVENIDGPSKKGSGRLLLVRLLPGSCEADLRFIVSAELEELPTLEPKLPFDGGWYKFCENWATAGTWGRLWELAEELIALGCTGVKEDCCCAGWRDEHLKLPSGRRLGSDSS